MGQLLTGSATGSDGTQTLAQLYARIECGKPAAPARVLARTKGAAGWEDLPGWRFFRNVVRAGLYMRERGGLAPGDRVVVVSPLRSERLVVEWATVIQGGVVAVVDPCAPDGELVAAIAGLSPSVVFTAGADTLARVRRACESTGPARHLVSFDAGGDATSWATALDLGGTLDTAERAQAFRAAARAVRPEMPAIAHPGHAGHPGGREAWSLVSHAQVVGKLLEFWGRFRSRRGDVAYVVDPGGPSRVRLAPWAFVADGETTLAIGTPANEERELADLAPAVVSAAPGAIERVRASSWAAGGHDSPAPASRRSGVLAWAMQRRRAPLAEAPAPRRLFTLEGEPRPLSSKPTFA